jgi:hypothetical protein
MASLSASGSRATALTAQATTGLFSTNPTLALTPLTLATLRDADDRLNSANGAITHAAVTPVTGLTTATGKPKAKRRAKNDPADSDKPRRKAAKKGAFDFRII